MRHLLLLMMVLALTACPGGGGKQVKVKWEPPPAEILRVADAAAFRVDEAGETQIALRDSPLKLDSAKGVRLFAVSDGKLKEVKATADGDKLEAKLDPKQLYLLSSPFTEFLTNRNRLLCGLQKVRWIHQVKRPFIPRICTMILCPPPDFRGRDLFDVEPEFRNLTNEFPQEFPKDFPDLPLSGSASTGNICEQCLRGGDEVIFEPPLIIDCPFGVPSPTITLIDVIPEAMSAETHQDSEPNLAVKPGNVQHIAASAFTRNPAGMGSAPIFVSDNRGTTWTACPTVESDRTTGDITLRFTRTTERLYAGILRLPALHPTGLRLNIQSTDDFLDCSRMMTVHVDRTQVDQPYVQATDVGGAERVYVGDNDFVPAAPGRTATVDQTAGPAGFAPQRIESRATSGQDLPPIRPAIGPDDVVYAAFIGRRAGALSDIVVVRDDAAGAGATPYRALLDGDGNAGVRVVTGINVPFENFSHGNFGQERLVASDLSIAVHPADATRVCVAWGDRQAGSVLTLHLRCSTDSGRTWTAGAGPGGDIVTLNDAKAPALAYNSAGVLGFLWQRFVVAGTTQTWETHIQRFDTSLAQIDDLTLARTPANVPVFTFIPYLGDYVHLMAVGNTFYGIFSANNTPDRNNFPLGVVYQRRHDFTTRTLQDLAGNTVPPSIDPFFFSLR